MQWDFMGFGFAHTMREKDSTEHRLEPLCHRYDLRCGVRAYGDGLGAMGLSDFSHGAIFVFSMLDGSADEG